MGEEEVYRVEADLVVDSSSMERKEMTRSEDLLMTGGEGDIWEVRIKGCTVVADDQSGRWV